MFTFCLIAAANGSIKMANRDVESGRPCLVLLCRVKLCDISPLEITVAFGDVSSIFIQ